MHETITKKRVGLLIPPYLGGRYFLQPPLGMLWTSALLKQDAIVVHLYDLRVRPLTTLDYNKLYNEYDYLIFCTSELDIVQNYPIDYRLQYALSLCREIKNKSRAKMIIVGAHGSVFPDEILRCSMADYVVVGEWELAVRNIVVSNELPKETIIYGKPGLFEKGIMPDYSSIDFDNYYGYSILTNDNVLSYNWSIVQSSRGCPYACEFCYNFYGRTMQFRTPENVYDDLKYQASLGVKTIFFIDSLFGVNREFTSKLCNLLIVKPLGLEMIVQTRAGLLDEDLLLLMKRAGFCGVWLGIESFEDSVLELCSKKTSSELNYSSIKMIRDAGLTPAAFMIQGLPGQTAESSKRDLEYLNSEGIRYNLSTLLIRPGSPLYKKTVCHYNNKVDPWRDVLVLKGKSLTGDAEDIVLDIHRKYSRRRPTSNSNNTRNVCIYLSSGRNHFDDCFNIINCIDNYRKNGISPTIHFFCDDIFANPYVEEIIKFLSDSNLSVTIISALVKVNKHIGVLSTIKGDVCFVSIEYSSTTVFDDNKILLNNLGLLKSDVLELNKSESVSNWVFLHEDLFDDVVMI